MPKTTKGNDTVIARLNIVMRAMDRGQPVRFGGFEHMLDTEGRLCHLLQYWTDGELTNTEWHVSELSFNNVLHLLAEMDPGDVAMHAMGNAMAAEAR